MIGNHYSSTVVSMRH